MLTAFKNTTATVRRAIVLSMLALLSFAFPIMWAVVLKFYGQGLALFWVLYLVLAILATFASVTASRRVNGETRKAAGNSCLLSMVCPWSSFF